MLVYNNVYLSLDQGFSFASKHYIVRARVYVRYVRLSFVRFMDDSKLNDMVCF